MNLSVIGLSLYFGVSWECSLESVSERRKAMWVVDFLSPSVGHGNLYVKLTTGDISSNSILSEMRWFG